MLKLTERELKVLSAAHMQADSSLESLHSETGMRVDTIRYTLKRLRDRHLIELNPIIDVYRLGYTQYGLFFSLSGEDPEQHEQLISFLQSHPLVP